MEFNLGFIGGGNMSTAIFKGILKSESKPNEIWVSGPHLENLEHWKKLGAKTTTSNEDILMKCNLVFLGMKPYQLNNAMRTNDSFIKKLNNKNILFISMLAGVTIEELRKVLRNISCNSGIIRIMPNTPMTVGAGSCLITPDNETTEPIQILVVKKMLSGAALCTEVPEPMMNSLGAMVGCGPAYMFLVIEALADGAVKQGVPRDIALKFAAQMMMGSAKLVLETNKHPGVLKDEVCSPGGSTICGVAVLENQNIRSAFINAVEASTQRNKELGNN